MQKRWIIEHKELILPTGNRRLATGNVFSAEASIDVVLAKRVHFAVDGIQQLYVEGFRILALDRNAETVRVDIINENVAGPSQDSQHIFLLIFTKINPVVLHTHKV